MTCITFLTLAIFLSAVKSDTITSRRLLPIGYRTVEQCNKYNAIYVDKTAFAMKLLQSGGTSFLFLRPRRFGKTFFLNTLESILQGEQHVFKNYFIGNPQNGYDWEVHLVLRLTFQEHNPINTLLESLVDIAVCNDVDKELAHLKNTSELYFEMLLRKLSPRGRNGKLKPGNKPPLALLIDEYDLPFKNSDTEIRVFFRKIFTLLKKLADERVVRFVFLTGCNKVNLFADYKKNTHSGLSTTLGIEDISLLPQYGAVCGFTKKEIEIYFHDHVQEAANIHNVTSDVIYQEMEDWYEGYQFTPDSPLLYNPISLLYYLRDKHIRKPVNYWTQTQDHPRTAMEALIAARIRNKTAILDLETRYTADELFQPVEEKVSNPDRKVHGVRLTQPSLESVLFQNGYLTIDTYDHTSNLYSLKLPNTEILEVFMQGIKLAMENDEKCMTLHREAKGYLQNLNIDMFVETFNTFVHVEPYSSLLKKNTDEREAFLKGFLQYLLTLDKPSNREQRTSEWKVHRETWTRKSSGSGGEVDFFIETLLYKILIECKCDATSTKMEKAVNQTKNYKFPWSGYKNKSLVRLTFNLNEDGIFQWVAAEYDSEDKFVRNLIQDPTKKPNHMSASRKKLSCPYCQPTNTFSKKWNLKRHMMSAHNKTMYE